MNLDLVSAVLGSTAESKRIACENLVGVGSSASPLTDLHSSLTALPQVLLDLFHVDGFLILSRRLLVGSTQHQFQRVLTTNAAHLSVISFGFSQ